MDCIQVQTLQVALNTKESAGTLCTGLANVLYEYVVQYCRLLRPTWTHSADPVQVWITVSQLIMAMVQDIRTSQQTIYGNSKVILTMVQDLHSSQAKYGHWTDTVS